jgi:hypothetical protein
MTSREGAKRKAPRYPSEVIDLVDDNDTEDAGLVLGDTRREVINLVDDNDESKPRANLCKTIRQSGEAVLLVDDREPVEFFNQLRQAGVTCERRRLATFDFLWVARRCTTAIAIS